MLSKTFMDATLWQQEQEAAGHIVSTVSKQREVSPPIFSFLFSLMPQPMGWRHPYTGQAFPSARPCYNIFTDTLRGLLPMCFCVLSNWRSRIATTKSTSCQRHTQTHLFKSQHYTVGPEASCSPHNVEGIEPTFSFLTICLFMCLFIVWAPSMHTEVRE